MLLEANFGGNREAGENGEQMDFAITMPAPIDGNGFEAEVEGGEMRRRRQSGMAQDRERQQSAEPGRLLQNG